MAALLHDIGKIVVPAEIFSKPGRLTEPEMQIIRQHADAGANTAALIGFEGEVAEIIRQHHERLDGSGYPRGLRGPDILAEARIVAVADVIEAMVSHRPYRPGVAIEVALDDGRNGAGTRYDAKACETAVSLVREHRFEFSIGSTSLARRCKDTRRLAATRRGGARRTCRAETGEPYGLAG